MRSALAHDWLVEPGGSEAVLREFLKLFPEAPLFVLFWESRRWREVVGPRTVVPSYLQRIPGITRMYRYLPALFPRAVESLPVRKGRYDLVLSSSHAVIKGLIPPEGAVHICYCYTPMRYIWDLQEVYLSQVPGVARGYARRVFARLREWEVRSAERVTKFVAISRYVAQRIHRFLGRDAEVVYPPVDVGYFSLPEGTPAREAYLVVSRFVPNKNVDLVLEVARRVKERFDIVGSGPLEGHLRARAPENVRFCGRVSREVLRELYRNARALVFLSVEDFGIASVEAQACGTPVVVSPEGGLPETIEAGVTGVVADALDAEAVVSALNEVAKLQTPPARFREHALQFGWARFYDDLRRILAEYGFRV